MGEYYIPIEMVYDMQRMRQRINKPYFGDIVWTKNGKPLKINPKVLDDFEMTGLNNCDFITTNYYLKKVKEDK